ncbi:MurR/RpiR family transcriptional regulator [Marinihelvus fidelis]|uniref:MurR/RpiR family transcriptional regulator n=1 Tax=Marinihelvus fidelis TaxID=2613842 RepID=A0A5N0TCG2_9GAMM|nr:MurR/RpiR family transcriptional regulator [Marinihelvus fidelis]KAA9132783.1 MurR/RpiR family transcriptional regulator [Marinihelvus fidelis]
MSCLAKIRAFQDELSPNEKKIARFILDNPALIRDYSSQSLAHAVGVSQSSIVKFSQKLGFRGFTDLKLAIHEAFLTGDGHDNGDGNGNGGVDDDASVAELLYQTKQQALLNTMQLNEEKQLEAAVDILEKAQRTQIIAMGWSALAARHFASMLSQIGRAVIAETDAYFQLSSVATLGKGDAIFLVSLTGQAPRTLEAVKKARRAGVKVVTLTTYSANPFRSLADVQLYSVSTAGKYELPQIVSMTSQQYMIDLLFKLIIRRNRKAKELLALNRQDVESF